jgi:crossover junction endodeoxyribonuclease RusA
LESFEFIVEGPAVSLKAKKTNSKRYQKWIKIVRAAAKAKWPGDRKPVRSHAITVHITNYYSLAPPDVDNIIKPILDALQPDVYVDDQQVVRVISEKFDLTYIESVTNPSPLLAAGLEEYTELLHIEVIWEAEE